MKKKIFLVSVLVTMAMSAMFVACGNDKNEATNGCNCTIRDSSDNQFINSFTALDMKEMGATTCGELAPIVEANYKMSEDYKNVTITVTCK